MAPRLAKAWTGILTIITTVAERERQPATIVISALGGGLGHCMRGLGLARALSQRGFTVEVLSNGALVEQWQQQHQWPWLTVFSGTLSRGRVQRIIGEKIQQTPCSVFIADVFAAGLGGELTTISWPQNTLRVLLSRRLQRWYADKCRAFASSYDLHIAVGEPDPYDFTHTIHAPPVIYSQGSERLAAQQARAHFGIFDQRPLVVIVASGNTHELLQARNLHRDLATKHRQHHIKLLLPQHRQPRLGQLLTGIDAVISNGGYQTVWECRLSGTPIWARPQHRRYDNQFARLTAREYWRTRSQLAHRLSTLQRRKARSFNWPNGAEYTAEIIIRHLAQNTNS